jgi:hypothetical protein
MASVDSNFGTISNSFKFSMPLGALYILINGTVMERCMMGPTITPRKSKNVAKRKFFFG